MLLLVVEYAPAVISFPFRVLSVFSNSKNTRNHCDASRRTSVLNPDLQTRLDMRYANPDNSNDIYKSRKLKKSK